MQARRLRYWWPPLLLGYNYDALTWKFSFASRLAHSPLNHATSLEFLLLRLIVTKR